MIFVTVGTHEQQFNRLIKEVDRLKQQGVIKEEVFIQTGYSNYIPQYCEYSSLLTYQEMEEYIDKASIVITHGGPASFMNAICKGKKVIIVPRLKKYSEHVNDHQLFFLNNLVKFKYYDLEFIENINDLKQLILSLKNNGKSEFFSKNIYFSNQLKKIVGDLF